VSHSALRKQYTALSAFAIGGELIGEMLIRDFTCAPTLQTRRALCRHVH
jgi:hypothetical protein